MNSNQVCQGAEVSTLNVKVMVLQSESSLTLLNQLKQLTKGDLLEVPDAFNAHTSMRQHGALSNFPCHT